MTTALFLLLIVSLVFVALIFVFGKQPEKLEVFEEIRSPVVLQILVPRENEKTPLAAEQMFASVHGILRDSKKSLDLFSLEIVSSEADGIRFYVVIPKHLAKFLEGQIYAQYPNADIKVVPDYSNIQSPDAAQSFVTTGEVELAKDYIFPIKTFRNFEVDPLAAITGAIGDLQPGEEAWIQMVARPIANYWQDAAKDYITAIREGKSLGGKSIIEILSGMMSAMAKSLRTGDDKEAARKESIRLAPGQEEELGEIEQKMLKLGMEMMIRIVTKSADQMRSEQILQDTIASFKQFTTAHLNSFIHSAPEKGGEELYGDYKRRFLASDTTDIVNIEELASVFHLPNISVETPNIAWSRARKAEPPMDLPQSGTNGVNIFAETDYRGQRVKFGIKPVDRMRHFYLLGKTGVGKSTVFKNMFLADVMAGAGACFIDPHGDDAVTLLDYIPKNRLKDVVYFDPTDIDNPIGFNMLQLNDPSQRDLVADGVVEVFKKHFEDSWGPRLQYLLTNAVATALEAQGTTLLSVMRILNDKNYRKFILKQVKDPILLKFWEEEYLAMSQNSRLITEALAPIQNKVGRFLSSSVIRNIIGQVQSTINLREIMDEGKILIVNLAQGKLGEESSSLLGGMLITRLQSTAMERVDVPIEQRRPFYLYVDEFQNFATESFAKILSEARKFRLGLTMTNQYIDQLTLPVRQAIFGNVGSIGAFVVSPSDAQILANEFAPTFSAEDLVSLESHAMYMKLAIDGMTSKPFSARSLDGMYEPTGVKEELLTHSRSNYGMPRAEIEEKIMKWSKQSYSEKGNRSLLPKGTVLEKKVAPKKVEVKRVVTNDKKPQVSKSKQQPKSRPVAKSKPKSRAKKKDRRPVLRKPTVSKAQGISSEITKKKSTRVNLVPPQVGGKDVNVS